MIIRKEGKRAVTPPTIIIREQPPPKPDSIPDQVIVIPGRRITGPRRVIIEKLPDEPPKPQKIIYEKWLPYDEPERRVVYEKPCMKKNIALKKTFITIRIF